MGQGTYKACGNSCDTAVREVQLAEGCLAVLGEWVEWGSSIHYTYSFHPPGERKVIWILCLNPAGVTLQSQDSMCDIQATQVCPPLVSQYPRIKQSNSWVGCMLPALAGIKPGLVNSQLCLLTTTNDLHFTHVFTWSV